MQCNAIQYLTNPTRAGSPRIFSPVGGMVVGIASSLVEQNTPTWRLHAQREKFLPEAGRKVTLGWASDCPRDADAWTCLFGQGEAADAQVQAQGNSCNCEHYNGGGGSDPSLRDLQLAMLGAFVLGGNRTSSHLQQGQEDEKYTRATTKLTFWHILALLHSLPPAPLKMRFLLGAGPAPPPLSEEYSSDGGNGIAVSVHVRGGDSCDLATRSHSAHTWAFWPFQWDGAKGANWQKVRR